MIRRILIKSDVKEQNKQTSTHKYTHTHTHTHSLTHTHTHTHTYTNTNTQTHRETDRNKKKIALMKSKTPTFRTTPSPPTILLFFPFLLNIISHRKSMLLAFELLNLFTVRKNICQNYLAHLNCPNFQQVIKVTLRRTKNDGYALCHQFAVPQPLRYYFKETI